MVVRNVAAEKLLVAELLDERCAELLEKRSAQHFRGDPQP
jgi:hypothetical protein